jgi:hypothetical protein
MIEPMADPEIVGRFDDLRFHSPLAAVEQLGPKESLVRVELEEQLAGRSLRRGSVGRRLAAGTA